MNNTKHILLIIIGVLSMSCSKDVGYGLDKSLARPENLEYDEVNSTLQTLICRYIGMLLKH